MPLPLYPQEKSPQYALDRRLGGPQSWSGQLGEEKILYPKGSLTPTHDIQPVARHYTNCTIPARYSYMLLLFNKSQAASRAITRACNVKATTPKCNIIF
jgi:hypothetical protein